MPPKANVTLRDASPLLNAFRNFLVGRKGKNALRYESKLSPRTQPPPNLPEGPAHSLSNNYYYTHDGRREMIPPAVVAVNMRTAVTSGEEASKQIGSRKLATPGPVFQWD